MGQKSEGGFGWQEFAKALSSFCVIVIFGVMLVGATLGMKPLERRATALSDAEVHVAIRWPSLRAGQEGTWLPAADQESLMDLARAALGASPDRFSPAPLGAVSSALGATGWFDSTPTVRRTGPASFVVEGEWRIPAAVVRWEDKDYLVSWDARRMPPVYDHDRARLPVILGSRVGPPAVSGGTGVDAWAGEGIGAALELIEVVSAQKWAGQIRAIDISTYADDSVLKMVTSDGGRIVWGGRPRKPRLGEVTTQQKLVHLAQLHHDHKRVDAGYPLIYINTQRVQFDSSASAGESRPAP
ncbi:MAG: hypothetical protein DYG92_09885 [Leptolyngbya sp. PLA1]|nr:hypothetical protein [Leptolyngbya sp. PLA1]